MNEGRLVQCDTPEKKKYGPEAKTDFVRAFLTKHKEAQQEQRLPSDY